MAVPPAGVVCIVGGNNVGKSQMLRDVPLVLSGHADQAVILRDVGFTFGYESPEKAEEWFRANAVAQRSQPIQFAPVAGGQHFDMSTLLNLSRAAVGGDLQALGHILGYLLRTLDAAARGGIAVGSMGHPGMDGTTRSPLHELFRDGQMEDELSAISLRTFGFPLTLDRANGDVRLRVGRPGVESPPLQHPTREYADAVLALPALSDQGDGVKNYLGMVLHLMTAGETVTLIDEPEAFLHPAQARRLGRHLATQAAEHQRQLLTATHDRDFVLGLLATETCPVTFVRLNRRDDVTSAATISSEQVKSIWNRPALRYSNLLQGLFHRAVAVCESDADCRWYAAVLDECGRKAGVDSEEVLFVPAGGKDQVPACLEALRALDVNAFGILDFDAVLNPDFVGTVLRSKDVEDERAIQLSKALQSQVADPEQRKRAKQGGVVNGLPAGDATRMGVELIERLKGHGLLILRVGELESFDRTLGGHGPPWVSSALTARRHESSPDAEALLEPLLSALAAAR